MSEAKNKQHFRHLLREIGNRTVLYRTLCRLTSSWSRNPPKGAIGERGEARMPLRRPMLASAAGQKSCCAKFARITRPTTPDVFSEPLWRNGRPGSPLAVTLTLNFALFAALVAPSQSQNCAGAAELVGDWKTGI